MDYKLAIDIGASSGRGIIGYKENDEIKTTEVYRFSNNIEYQNGHLIWNVDYIYDQVINTIKVAISSYDIKSLSIDTWGVDYVLLDNYGNPIKPCYAYRDHRTSEAVAEVEKIIPFKELYLRTGCQFQEFNTLYQLYEDKLNGRLDGACDFLMIPEYLNYLLTGKKVKEFTNATTTGLINKDSLKFDLDIIKKLNLPKQLFKKLENPKTIIGSLKENVAKLVGGNCKVILCATHDTASAVEGISIDKEQLYISSGTWSLLGIKTKKPIVDLDSMYKNYSNEGGVGYNRYQKNIMGLWIAQNLRNELCPNFDWNKIVKLAEASNYSETFDCENKILLSPASMKDALDSLLKNKPKQIGDYFRCAYISLAQAYKKAIEEIEHNINQKYSKIYIVGGGAKNDFLNKLVQEITHKEVIALPIEATAIGNLKIQMEVKDELSGS